MVPRFSPGRFSYGDILPSPDIQLRTGKQACPGPPHRPIPLQIYRFPVPGALQRVCIFPHQFPIEIPALFRSGSLVLAVCSGKFPAREGKVVQPGFVRVQSYHFSHRGSSEGENCSLRRRIASRIQLIRFQIFPRYIRIRKPDCRALSGIRGLPRTANRR